MKTPIKTPASGPNRRTVLAAGALIAPGSVTLAQADTSPAATPAVAAPPFSAAAAKAVSDAEPAILRISREVWENAELSRQEMKSHAIHLRELEAAGFNIADRNTSGYPTAFVAEWEQGSGGPVIAYVPEYDALPGFGNAAELRVNEIGDVDNACPFGEELGLPRQAVVEGVVRLTDLFSPVWPLLGRPNEHPTTMRSEQHGSSRPFSEQTQVSKASLTGFIVLVRVANCSGFNHARIVFPDNSASPRRPIHVVCQIV